MKYAIILILIVVAVLVLILVPYNRGGRSVPMHRWIVNLETNGGPLPFSLSYWDFRTDPGVWAGSIGGWYSNKLDFEFQKIDEDPHRILIEFPHYDSVLELNPDGENRLIGQWIKQRGDSEPAIVPAYATKTFHPTSLFESIENSDDAADFEGRWRVQFSSSEVEAVGTFVQLSGEGFEVDGVTIALGTFLTTTGDYGSLKGQIDGNLMRLSTFDGAHAFLFHARMQDDGTIEGDFWSGNWHHETWAAVRDDDAQLPDAFEQTSVTDEAALEELVFKDIEGTPISVFDALDATGAPARVLEIFGTWCPNCADAGRELVSLKTKYGDKLGIVGLAFEVTEDFERSATQVRRHHEHIGSDWAVLIAGLSDKDKATATLGFLDKVRSYPTLVFLDADNEVQAVYSGFSGPATGEAYEAQRERFEATIEDLIGE
ncbi:MAG: TlpA disulfide reductase family protein [Phycisphaerales bacterium]